MGFVIMMLIFWIPIIIGLVLLSSIYRKVELKEAKNPGNDRCPIWTPDGKIFLFDSARAGGFGSRDLGWNYFKDIMGYWPAYTPADAITSLAVR